jgi:uncharacterized membrane protein YagU involved in acid resistance
MNRKRSLTETKATLGDGAIAGFIATVPMTAVMVLLHRMLPRHERYPLPPRQITEEMSRRTGARKHMDESERESTTLLAHFGFGAAAGALYIVLANLLPMPPVLRGLVYGLMVWGGSYMGWLPAARVLPPATEQPTRRTLLMIFAHLVWGSFLALITHQLSLSRSRGSLREAM